jgi:hypothetical protein
MENTIPTRAKFSFIFASLRFSWPIFYSLLFIFSACTPDQQYQIAAGSIKKNWQKTAYATKEWPELLSVSEINDATLVINKSLNTLNTFQGMSLAIMLRKDEAAIRNTLTEARKTLERLQKDPSFYDFSARLNAKLAQADGAMDQKLQTIAPLLPLAEAYYRQAKLNLRPIDPTLCSAAVGEHIQGVSFLDQDIAKTLPPAEWSTKAKADFQKNLFQTKLALKDYLAWCRSQAFELRKRSQ